MKLCPPFYRYLSNMYQVSAKMIINDQEKTDHILSEDESQGDVSAMAMYAIGIRPLIDTLNAATDPSRCRQVWYADDSTAAGKLSELRKWWDTLYNTGPKYGYFPKPSKTILILKDRQLYDEAVTLFEHTEIEITLSGERHLGAVIGSQEHRDEYVEKKIRKWVKDVEQLASIAKDEPQNAYTAFTKAICCLLYTSPSPRDS